MPAWIGPALIALFGAALVVDTTREAIRMRSLRCHGIQVSGEVIDNDATPRPYYGGFLLHPVVRYKFNDKMREGTLRNWQGKIDLGVGVNLLIDPKRPWSPAAADRDDTIRSVIISSFILLVGVLPTLWSAHVFG